MIKCIFISNKKGQTEDILADLVPAIIIIVIAIYLLMGISSDSRINIEQNVKEVKSQLSQPVNYQVYLKESIGFKEKCANSKHTVSDVISKIDPFKAKEGKDDCYTLLLKTLISFNKKYLGFKGENEESKCMDLTLTFPTKEITLSEPLLDCVWQQDEQKILLPSLSGEYVELNINIGEKV